MSLIQQLSGIVGKSFVEPDVVCTDWRGLFTGHAAAVVRPSSTAEAAKIMAICAAHATPIVVRGGNTGLCGGATPRGGEVVVALDRLNRIRDLDETDSVIIAEAGVTLEAARAAASSIGMQLPLSLASGGSAQIGGTISTNAGGNTTLRYGNMREQVLGLEVVLADGQIWHGLRRLRKDNTGYALRYLFAGAEGTLGIITAACLRLVPAEPFRELAFVALPGLPALIALLNRVRRAEGPALHAFEYLSATALQMAVAQIPGCRDPFDTPAPAYALIELASSDPSLRARLETLLAAALDARLITNAILPENAAQAAALWRLREVQAEAQAKAGLNVKNDISVPIARIPGFILSASDACRAILPNVQIVDFGHAGDGNIHFNLVCRHGRNEALAGALMQSVSEAARQCGGSFSAEHGIGQLKTGLLQHWRDGIELELMRRTKLAFDPAGLLNPGKIFLSVV